MDRSEQVDRGVLSDTCHSAGPGTAPGGGVSTVAQAEVPSERRQQLQR
jgi:hypothetical protein